MQRDFDSSRLARLVSSATLEDGAPADAAKPITSRPCDSFPLFSKTTGTHEPHIPKELEEDLPTIISRSFTLVKRFSPWKTRFVELPSGIGFGNARALSKAFGLLACAPTSPVERIVGPKTAPKALEKSIEGFDLTFQNHRALTRSGYFMSEEYPSAFYHSGNGGALVWGDTKYGIGLSYTPNHLLGASTHDHGTRAEKLVRAVYFCIAQIESRQSKL